jgi:hypothetical protein
MEYLTLLLNEDQKESKEKKGGRRKGAKSER